MDNLALAYVTCDKYSHIWPKWVDGFVKYFSPDIPFYWCGEEKPAPVELLEFCPEFIRLRHESVWPERWTAKLREQIKQIPEENIFVWLDDLVIQKSIRLEFMEIYFLFNLLDADSFRIMPRNSASNMENVPFTIGGHQVKQLHPGPYMVSFHPNIFKKEFLLAALRIDESPWECEVKSQNRFHDKNIYSIQIDGWVSNEIVKGIPQ